MVSSLTPSRFQGKPCKHGHPGIRYKNRGRCVDCEAAKVRKWKKENPDKVRLSYLTDPKVNERSDAWKRRNKGKVNAATTARRLGIKKSCPAWLTEEQRREIRDIYIEAARLTETTGIQYHVDHIYPLNGKYSSGLHVPWNLQIITATENLLKGNKVEHGNFFQA